MAHSNQDNNATLRSLWRQHSVPVVFLRKSSLPLLINIPYSLENQYWLRNKRHRIPKWDPKYKAWNTPHAWFESVVKLCTDRYTTCYVVQLHREKQVCASACWDAQGFECECSCMGENHGAGYPFGRWYEIDETFAVSWGEQRYACRLVRAKNR